MIENLKVKIYADRADLSSMLNEYKRVIASGFTTNSFLIKQAGILDYRGFAKEVLENIKDMPISFEVFASVNLSLIMK